MNLTQFIKQVDTAASNLSKEKLEGFIHNIARSLPENQREDFLLKLCDLDGETSVEQGISLTKKADEIEIIEIKRMIHQTKEKLLLIENGDLCIVGSLNDEYDDWYNSSAEEFIFEDPENVVEIIEEACDLIHQCVDRELYKDCRELVDKLLPLEITVGGDYSDYGCSDLSLKELKENGLSSFDYRQLIMDALYAAYWSNPLKERPDALYQIICISECQDVTLEALVQEGKTELEQLPDFVKIWIEYLGDCEGNEAERLLLEAVSLQNDSMQSLEAARKFAKKHPSLYEQILKQNLTSGNDEEQFIVGQEALQAILPQYIIRSRAALLTAEYALRLKKHNEAEQCWLEAFRSDTRLVNYLRLAVNSIDFSKYREEAERIYNKCFETTDQEKNYHYQAGELRVNRIDDKTYFTLAFFGGEFRHVIEEGMDEQESLGWSFTFMKEGIALFLLYLYKAENLTDGLRSMCDKVIGSSSFASEEYSQGLHQPAAIDNTTFFWECFRKWKKMMPMPVSEEQLIIVKLEEWIRIRVEGIMQGNYRKYYWECAALIAALGEVRESLGEINGKAKLMEGYKLAYSRRTAFHQELRVFGMKDTRRK